MPLIKVNMNKAAAISGNATGLPRRSNISLPSDTWRRSTWRVVIPALQECGQAAEQREYGRGATDYHDQPECGFHQLVPFDHHHRSLRFVLAYFNNLIRLRSARSSEIGRAH